MLRIATAADNGHPGPGGKQTGTKDNAREELAYLQDLSAAVKQAVNDGKSYADAQKDIKLPKYESWPNYNAFLPMNIERYYDFWNRDLKAAHPARCFSI